MPRLPDLLRLLTRDELLAAADRLGVALPERRAKDPIVEALAAAPAATPEAVLADLKRDRLKALCRALDLDDSGKEKAEIIARLAGGPATSENRGQDKLDFAGTTSRTTWFGV
ncbi:MAG: SAP domain-containing protein [Nannocystis sp.]|nr:SAP domain-containing protein [Nannocystis sp.]